MRGGEEEGVGMISHTVTEGPMGNQTLTDAVRDVVANPALTAKGLPDLR